MSPRERRLASVADRLVVRGGHGVRRVRENADFVLTHGGGMRDENVARFHRRQRLGILV